MEYKSDKEKQNRQYNNKLIINYIEKNSKKAEDKNAYEELISFLDENLEYAFFMFYEDKNELDKINKNEKCIYFDKFFKKETDISLLEKNGFIKAMKRKIKI